MFTNYAHQPFKKNIPMKYIHLKTSQYLQKVKD